MWGETFAKGETFSKLAEGVMTSSALLNMAEKVDVELPITRIVYDVINNKITKDEAIKRLFARQITTEF